MTTNLSSTRRSFIVKLLVLSTLAGLGLPGRVQAGGAAVPEGWALCWEEQFQGSELDAANWKASDGGTWLASNVRVADGALRLRASVDGPARLGGEVATGNQHGHFQLRVFSPPIRVEIRFKPVMKPGSFIALWLMHAGWNRELYAAEGMMAGKEFDLLECAGGENLVTEDQIEIQAHMAVHAWWAPQPWITGGHRSCQFNTVPTIGVGNPIAWQELRLDWDDESRPAGRELRYYWRGDGQPWDEPRLVLRPARDFFPPNHTMNRPAFGDVRNVDLLDAVWNEPMHLILWNQARQPERWLSQERLAEKGENRWGGPALDPGDFPFEMPIDCVRVYVPAGDPRLQP